MTRILLFLPLPFLLSGCEPTFEEKVIGYWICNGTLSDSEAEVAVRAELNYLESRDVRGTLTAKVSMGGQAFESTSDVLGSWNYDGEKMTQQLSNPLRRLSVNGMEIPMQDVPEDMKQEMSTSESFQDRVELVDANTMVWPSDEGALTCLKK